MSSAPQVPGVEIRGEWREGYEQVLTEESLGLLARLQHESGPRRAELLTDELETIEQAVGEQAFAKGRYDEARELFEQVALADDLVEFLTLPAYERLA